MKESGATRWFAFLAVCGLAGTTFLADRLHLLDGVRLALQDALSPGRMVATSILSPHHKAADPASPGEQDEIRKLEQQRRELLAENVRLYNELRQWRPAGLLHRPTAPLAGLQLIEARVLGRQGVPGSLRSAMIEAGKTHGLLRSELVLDASGILLDLGQAEGLESGQTILSGLAVAGRIDRAGRWVSHLQPVTDPEFSMQVQLIHRSERGTQPGAAGIYQGTGTAGRITGIPATARVAVGDAVVSGSIGGPVGRTAYLGQVVLADFQSAGEWSVEVAPAVDINSIEKVLAVVPRINSDRIAADRPVGEQSR